VQSHAYRISCETRELHATEKACPLLVPLIEEGWVDHPVTRDVLRIYLREALDLCSPDVVILGCTHYPLIAPLVSETLKELGSTAEIIDSAKATALAVSEKFAVLAGLKSSARALADATFECYATDSVEKFARLGSQFLGRTIPDVKLLDLGG
jgi:glutamate racemase